MFKEKIVILDREVQRGESVVLEMDVAKLHTRNSLKVPIIIERAKEDGPVLLLMGGIHGDELNGVEIVRRIIHLKKNKPLRGTVICIPVFNIFGFINLSRQFPDGRDLNRVFPGSANGSLASQFAFQFKNKIAPVLEYVLDFHTGGADRVNSPQIRCLLNEEKNYALARTFGAPFIIHSKYIPKSVRDTLRKMGKTAILFEGGSASRFDQEVIECGFQGAMNVMISLGMQPGNPNIPDEMVAVKKSKWIRAPYSGMFRNLVKNGKWISRNTIMGMITDPYGEFERKVKAPADCYVFCINKSPIVNKGDALFHISLESEILQESRSLTTSEA